MAPILESFLAKTLINSYLRKKHILCGAIYPSGEKLASMVMNKLMKKLKFEDVVESSWGEKIINTCIDTYLGRDVMLKLQQLLEENTSTNFDLKAILDVHTRDISFNGSSKYMLKLGCKFESNQLHYPFELHITNDNIIVGMEYLWKKLDYSVNIPWVDYQVTKVPVKMTIKPVLDCANRNISVSTIVNGGKLFGCCATLGLTLPSSPTFGASVILNFGWIDAALIMKPQTMKFKLNFNMKPEIGFHVTMKHDNKHRESMIKGTASFGQSDGARRISVNTRGILTLGGKMELQESPDLMWEVGYDIKDRKIGLKFALGN